MLRRWLRAAANRIGIHLRFSGVICVEGTQSVSIETDWRARITTRRIFVFLEPPAAGDLCDTYALGVGKPISSVIYTSPNAIELSREHTRSGNVTVSWLPRDPVTLYTLYEHQNAWMPLATFNGSALCVEYQCDMRTGTFTMELVAPAPFETAIVFRRPAWPGRLTERRLLRSALKRQKAPGERPRIIDDGTRIECDVRRPRVGERYLLVAFRNYGVASCEEWLKETSIVGRAQRVVAGWAQAFID